MVGFKERNSEFADAVIHWPRLLVREAAKQSDETSIALFKL